MIHIAEEKMCCGCAVCSVVCPVDCIAMVTGTLGAVFPRVDAQRCIRCGKCESVCPILHAEETKNIPDEQLVYAAYSKNPETRKSGSSGGVFGVIAENLISQGYRVYGAAFDENMQLRCIYANTAEELIPLMKSKYLQSDVSLAYCQIKEDLEQNRSVMFVSTPCQVAALKRFLQKDYDKLLCVDFLCHGVPSQLFFDKCKEYEEKKHRYNMLSYSFRSKIKGGATPHYFTVTTEKNGKTTTTTKPYFHSSFYAFFQKYITLRESCYECVFSERGRVSDLTIADFHDIEKYVSDINRFDGVSTVILNTEKGKMLFDSIKDKLWLRQFSMEQLLNDKVLFSEKTKRPVNRDKFIEDYENMEFSDFVNHNMDTKRYAIFGVYYKLPKFMRSLVKKLCHIE